MDFSIIEEVSKKLGIDKDRVIEESLREWIEGLLTKVEAEIADILIRYGVEGVRDFEEKIRKGEVSEHLGWEDLITLEKLLEKKKRIEEALRLVKKS